MLKEKPSDLLLRLGRDGAAQGVRLRTGDIERQNALDAHPLDVKLRLLVPAEIAPFQAVIVNVLDSRRYQVGSSRQAVFSGIQGEMPWVGTGAHAGSPCVLTQCSTVSSQQR